MYWKDENDSDRTYVVPDDVVDLSFRLHCRSLPTDHAHALSAALREALPWLMDEPQAGIHLIHGAESGNGWIRPEAPGALIYPSRRTRLTLRLPAARAASAESLRGRTLDIDGNPLTLGETSRRKLSPLTTIFARYVITQDARDEEAFLVEVTRMLSGLGIRPRKMLGGRIHTLRMPDGEVITRSLMIDGIDVEESVHLQQTGLGPGRKIGCGLFLPHKGIAPVARPQDV